jgi:hypothetical protein
MEWSNPMRSQRVFRWAAALVLAVSMIPSPAVAQNGDTISITGTFKMSEVLPTVGVDLAAVQPNAADRWWKLSLHGVTYSHDYLEWWDEYGYNEKLSTRAHATSFTLEFFGADAAVLNSTVSGQLAGGGLPGGAALEIANRNISYEAQWGTFDIWLVPSGAEGISFRSYGQTDVWYHWFEPQLPQPRRLVADESLIQDFRNGNSGALVTRWPFHRDIVDLNSDEQPLQPPPPPPLPTISIADASKPEGNRGTTTLLMTVTLDRASDQAVTVSYSTNDGTADYRDYYSASGTLTFQPGETSKTISVSIIGDRKREPNETFSIQLSNAVGAAIDDAVGVATILNDD